MQKQEVLAGVVAAVALLPSLIVVALLLQQAGMNFTGAYTATVSIALLGAVTMGCLRHSILLAPSVSVTAALVYVPVISQGVRWEQLLGVSALISFLYAVWQIGIGKFFHNHLQVFPTFFQHLLPMGIGILLIWQALIQSRIIIRSPWAVTMLGNLQEPLAYFSGVGIICTVFLLAMRWKLALLYGMLLTLMLTFFEGFWAIPDVPFLPPEGLEKTMGMLSLSAADDLQAWRLISMGISLFAILSSVNQSVALALPGKEALDRKSFVMIGGLGIAGGWLGTLCFMLSPISLVASSISGGKSRAAFYSAFVFLLALFCEPILAAWADFPAMLVPVLAGTGFWLISQGLRRKANLRESWEGMPQLWSAVCILLLLPLTGDFVLGIGSALLGYCALMLASGQGRQVNWGMWLMAFFYGAYFIWLSL